MRAFFWLESVFAASGAGGQAQRLGLLMIVIAVTF